jgi:hypothetical protein
MWNFVVGDGDVRLLSLSTILDTLYHFEDAFELFLLSRFGLEDNKDVKKIYSSFNLLDNCKRVMMTELLDVCNN